jgi:hypothetical protein
VGEPLLGPDRVEHLGVRVEGDAKAALVQVGGGLTQLRDPPARRVPVVPRVPGRLAQLVDGHVGRRQIGVAEAEVDDVLAVAPKIDLEPVDDGEDVRGKRRDAPELHRR